MDTLDILILVAAAVVALAYLLAARGWPGGERLRGAWQRVEPYLGCYVRRSPGTFTYMVILFVTTWVVAGAGLRLSEALLRSQSTNVANLRARPLAVLFRSAFFSGEAKVLPVIALIAVVLAPAEVWLGTARLVFVFAAGHIGATLITSIAIEDGLFGSPARHGLARTIDVGVSYGTFCVAAILAYRLRRPWALLYAGLLLLVFGLLGFVYEPTFTDFGHFVSVCIGFAVYPLVRSRSVDRRRQIPMYRPWLDPAVGGPP